MPHPGDTQERGIEGATKPETSSKSPEHWVLDWPCKGRHFPIPWTPSIHFFIHSTNVYCVLPACQAVL